MNEEKIEYKLNVPMFEVGELEIFDNHIHDIVEDYSKMLFKEKEQILTQRIIMKQEQEIERLNNIIKEVRKYIEKMTVDNPDTDFELEVNTVLGNALEILDKGE